MPVQTCSHADRYDSLALDRLARAARVRERAEMLDDSLAPLRTAMMRRACELELASVALHEIAEGQRAVAA